MTVIDYGALLTDGPQEPAPYCVASQYRVKIGIATSTDLKISLARTAYVRYVVIQPMGDELRAVQMGLDSVLVSVHTRST